MSTPWPIIIGMFAYAMMGWVALYAIHCFISRPRVAPESARQAARGYGESWSSSSTADS